MADHEQWTPDDEDDYLRLSERIELTEDEQDRLDDMAPRRERMLGLWRLERPSGALGQIASALDERTAALRSEQSAEQQYARCTRCAGFLPVPDQLLLAGWTVGTPVDHPLGGCPSDAGEPARTFLLEVRFSETYADGREDELLAKVGARSSGHLASEVLLEAVNGLDAQLLRLAESAGALDAP